MKILSSPNEGMLADTPSSFSPSIILQNRSLYYQGSVLFSIKSYWMINSLRIKRKTYVEKCYQRNKCPTKIPSFIKLEEPGSLQSRLCGFWEVSGEELVCGIYTGLWALTIGIDFVDSWHTSLGTESTFETNSLLKFYYGKSFLLMVFKKESEKDILRNSYRLFISRTQFLTQESQSIKQQAEAEQWHLQLLWAVRCTNFLWSRISPDLAIFLNFFILLLFTKTSCPMNVMLNIKHFKGSD